ncbi:lipocalin-like domain-containing protein [Novosphingobium album (ex Liu et al. 2023)]|uniref:Lipocalin-like domain-containing protein n=1 Tax=Novosphingobium album (ex Liu et al. 2023) TaxID=3031130 RepID=A0ABT5WR05_9SPHN|nr:lipocalin-like domain-containing protein [Novosphingobium album (ex Liu et al. 2023)]MDE8652425.1 lipocalin-like domain-containing protein [Novosphingobium album (ex Liu et al. 2023)]
MTDCAIDPENLYGIWRLVRSTAVDKHGSPIRDPWGPRPSGILVLERSGRMMAQLVDGRHDVEDCEERAYSSYTGRYTVERNILTTTIDGASDPTRIGSRQPREMSSRNGELILAPPTRPDGERREIYWVLVAPEPRQ